jgi:predicted ATPase
MTTAIVLTGAPASGKTTIFEQLRNDPEFEGFVFLEELARKLLSENPDYRQNWPAFHVEIYRRQVERETSAGGKPFVSDRGTVDAFAFHPETMIDVHTTLEEEYERYTAVVHLGSAADLGEEYFTRDDIRNESVADALVIEQALKDVWGQHAAYHFIPAEPDFALKVERAVALIKYLAFQN